MNKKSTIAFSALAFSLLLASCNKTPATDDNKPGTDNNNPQDVYKPVEVPSDFNPAKDMPKTKTTLNSMYGTDPLTLALFDTNRQPDSMHIANFIDGWVEHDNYGKMKPALAEKLPEQVINKDGTASYTLKLKADTPVWSKWENGKLVKAADVKPSDFVLSAKLSLDPHHKGTSYLFFSFIKGSQDYFMMQIPEYKKDADGKVIKDADGKKVVDPNWKAPTQAELDKFWDENVGIKCDDKAGTVTYTLPKPMDYFPSVLTYPCFYPVPQDLYNKITSKYGSIDGDKTKDYLWYNGAFALNKFVPSSTIEYAKNDLYWDADKVSLEKIHYDYLEQEKALSYVREQFELGAVDSFPVQPLDEAGWNKYVKGEDGKGTIGDPHHEYANAHESTPEGTTFYLGYNFHRSQMSNTELPESEVRNFEKAIANVNFRKAILYATDKGSYNARNNPQNPLQWATNTYTIPTLAVDDNGRDYVDYIYDEFAYHNDMTHDEAKAIIGSGKAGVYNPSAAKTYLELAKAELGSTVSYPVKFEIVEQANADQTPFYLAFAEKLQENLDPKKEIIDITVKQLTSQGMDKAFGYQDYSVAGYFGWGPDYGDPLTFLNTLASGGDLTPNMGIDPGTPLDDKMLGTYTNLVQYADSLTDKQARLKAYAQAEYYLLYEQAIIIPLTQRFQGLRVHVTKLKPKTAQLVPYGSGADKMKDAVVYEKELNKVQFAYCLQQYEKGKEAAK